MRRMWAETTGLHVRRLGSPISTSEMAKEERGEGRTPQSGTKDHKEHWTRKLFPRENPGPKRRNIPWGRGRGGIHNVVSASNERVTFHVLNKHLWKSVRKLILQKLSTVEGSLLSSIIYHSHKPWAMLILNFSEIQYSDCMRCYFLDDVFHHWFSPVIGSLLHWTRTKWILVDGPDDNEGGPRKLII